MGPPEASAGFGRRRDGQGIDGSVVDGTATLAGHHDVTRRGRIVRADRRAAPKGTEHQVPTHEDQVGIVEHPATETRAAVGLPDHVPLSRVAVVARGDRAEGVARDDPVRVVRRRGSGPRWEGQHPTRPNEFLVGGENNTRCHRLVGVQPLDLPPALPPTERDLGDPPGVIRRRHGPLGPAGVTGAVGAAGRQPPTPGAAVRPSAVMPVQRTLPRLV
jgi:hypothetical protein